jgi:hypothetical protein
MARLADDLKEDRLLRTYLKGLVRGEAPRTAMRTPGHEVRTCANCGRSTTFRLDPDGVWTTCSSCGRYA